MDNIKNAFWASSLYINGLGLLALLIFYIEFGISLYPYFSLSDGAFYMIYIIFTISMCMAIIELVTGLIYIICTARESEEKARKKKNRTSYIRWTLIFEAVVISVYLILHIWFDWSYYWIVFAILIFHIIVKLYIYMRNTDNKGFLRFLLCFGVTALTLFACILSYCDARNIIDGKSTTKYELITTDTIYSTSSTPNIFYIGESSSTIFLYDRTKNNTVIINKDYPLAELN